MPKKLQRTDILAVVTMGREGERCEAPGLSSCERPVVLRLSKLMASVALWPGLTGLLQWVDCQQVKS